MQTVLYASRIMTGKEVSAYCEQIKQHIRNGDAKATYEVFLTNVSSALRKTKIS